jgi:hypothetical protein
VTLLFLWWDKRSPAVLGLDPKPRRLGELALGWLGGMCSSASSRW